jgi:hypothetical protein
VGEFKGSWFCMPCTLELGKATNKWGKAGSMAFTIKPSLVPPPEGSFQWGIDETTVGVSLKANTTDNFLIGGARMVFKKEIIFESGKVWGNSKDGATKMDKDCNLED